ncbi:hypothetical protein L1987_01277 [Smallanthus sonchifolius]|uniref:Uncharacterized protein n=1 Tax=Smallanthus sonchifolius TaxID=185202 RepID=A0ACB9K4H5_9ASTR|nr:hypothetical protein L1987_01277 [Smallanthus sonchifolius]
MVGYPGLNQSGGEPLSAGLTMVRVSPVTIVGAKVHLETLLAVHEKKTTSEISSGRRQQCIMGLPGVFIVGKSGVPIGRFRYVMWLGGNQGHSNLLPRLSLDRFTYLGILVGKERKYCIHDGGISATRQ